MLSICSRCRRSRRPRHHSSSARIPAATSNASQGLSMRPIATGAESQSKAASNTATAAVAMGVRWMVRKDTCRFSTRTASNRSGKLRSWSEHNVAGHLSVVRLIQDKSARAPFPRAMKLFLCNECGEVFSLRLRTRACLGGHGSGVYLNDGVKAAVRGPRKTTFVLALGNAALVMAAC
jgi:hypothetical protein